MIVNRFNGLANALVAALLLANLSLFFVVWRLWQFSPWNEPTLHARLGGFSGAIFIGLFYVSRRLFGHRSKITTLPILDRLVLSLRMVCGFLLGAALIHFLVSPVYPGRFFILLFVACSFPFNVVALQVLPRWLARYFFSRHGRERAVLVGTGELPGSLWGYVERCRVLGIEFVGHYAERPVPGMHQPHLGSLNDLLACSTAALRGKNPDCTEAAPEYVLAYNFDHTEASFRKLVEFCHQRGIRLQAYTRMANVLVDPVELVTDGDLNFLVFMNEPLQDPLNRLIKRTVDIAVSLPIVLFFLPCLTMVVWLMQRLQSPGPVIFRQLRYGTNRKPFCIYKFRTMHLAVDQQEFLQARENDARVYPFGRFMRKMSLDEFPQFLNVLKGEMSVVGPRPHPLKLDEDMEHSLVNYRLRHFVRPGITGYAQVLGLRGETRDTSLLVERVRKDIHYIRRWSLTFDLKILLQTAWQLVFPPKTAY